MNPQHIIDRARRQAKRIAESTPRQQRALRKICAGCRPIGGIGGRRERLLKNYVSELAKTLRRRSA